MTFDNFLDLTKIIRMIWGVPVSKKFFLDNIKQFDKVVDSNSLINLK